MHSCNQMLSGYDFKHEGKKQDDLKRQNWLNFTARVPVKKQPLDTHNYLMPHKGDCFLLQSEKWQKVVGHALEVGSMRVSSVLLSSVLVWLRSSVLGLGSCLHTKDCPDRCACVAAPREPTIFSVDCAHQAFTSLPAALPICVDASLTEGYHLNFSHNNLSALENSSSSLTDIYYSHYLRMTQVLDLSFNMLTTVSGLFLTDLNSLRVIYLQGNQLTHLPENDLVTLQALVAGSLYAVTLKDNPWVCDCSLLPLKRWLLSMYNSSQTLEGEVAVADAEEMICWGWSDRVPVIEAELRCEPEEKSKHVIPTYISAIIGLVLLYLLVCMFVAICIVIRNRHKVKAQDMQLT